MSDLIIPCNPSLSHYTMTVTLDGANYDLAFDWNSRASRWYMTLMDTTDSPIAASLCLLVGVPLLMSVTDVRRPPGDFVAIDTSGQNIEAGLNDLGNRVQVRYVPIADLTAAGI